MEYGGIGWPGNELTGVTGKFAKYFRFLTILFLA